MAELHGIEIHLLPGETVTFNLPHTILSWIPGETFGPEDAIVSIDYEGNMKVMERGGLSQEAEL